MNARHRRIAIYGLALGAAVFAMGYRYAGPLLISRSHVEIETGSDDVLAPYTAAAGSAKKRRPVQAPSPSLQPVGASFAGSFDAVYTLVEAGSIRESKSRTWWLSSGAYFYSANGVGRTVAGALSAIDPWRVAFSISNPLDTDNGYHPQNIFRLVLASRWQNFRQETYFNIRRGNLSESFNRNASNGLLLFNRYQDSDNLYYAGIRVDGYAVVKKKYNGAYYTMAYRPWIGGSSYDREGNPNVLPKDVWIGLRSEVKNEADGAVSIKLFVDQGRTGNWILAAEAHDDGTRYGGPAILDGGYGGIRTDFMDVEFSGYRISEF